MNYDSEVIRWYGKEIDHFDESDNPMQYHARSLKLMFEQGMKIGKQKTLHPEKVKRFRQNLN